MSTAGDIPKPGDVLAGKYRIERAIAEGGMGVVVEATHLQLEERVAIKFLKPEVLAAGATKPIASASSSGSTEVASRFIREARAAIKIRSEHVVRIYDVASLESGAPYIVMEYLQGQDLDQLVTSRGALPTDEAVDHVLQACEALGEAHALGIVHRDLKPANLFLTTTATGVPIVKVLDFGISKLANTAGDMSMTSTQAVMGSPLYMSPEQMRSTRDADARSDIWAIGVILYELISAKTPFVGDTMTQVCAAILQDVPVTLASLRNDMPPGLDLVVRKCLEKRPADRYASVADLADALAPFASAVGQEAARRTMRSHKFSSSPRLAASSMTSEGPAGAALAMTSLAPGTDKPSIHATATAWGNEPANKPRSRIPVIAGVLAVAVLGIGAFAATRGKSEVKPDVASATPAGTASSRESLSAKVTANTPVEAPSRDHSAPAPSAVTSAAPTPSAVAAAPAPSASQKPTLKKLAAPPVVASPKPSPAPAVSNKASWNDRK